MTTTSVTVRDRVVAWLPLVWQGRLSWMRIALAIVYGMHTYHLVRGWQLDVPAPAPQGWFLGLVPSGIRDFLLGHPNWVAAGVIVLVVLIVIGLATRPALIALVLIGLFARTIEVSQGIFDHESSLTTQVLFVLAFAPGTNAISLEHLARWWRGGRKDLLVSLLAPYRQWGVYLILGILALTYTTSGFSKMRFSGVSWLNGETLGFYLRGLTAGTEVYMVGGGPPTWRDDFGIVMYTYGNYNYGNYHPAVLADAVDWVAHTPAILIALSVGTVVLELCGFLLFVPRLRSLLLIGYMCMHTTIGILMGLPFVEYQIVCFFLIEWERIFGFLLRWLDARRTAKVAAGTDSAAPIPAESSGSGEPPIATAPHG